MNPLLMQLMQYLTVGGGQREFNDPSNPLNGIWDEIQGQSTQGPMPLRVKNSLGEMLPLNSELAPPRDPKAALRMISAQSSTPPTEIPATTPSAGGRTPSEQATEDVAAIAQKLLGLPTMADARREAEMRARQNVVDKRDQINAGLKQRNQRALSGGGPMNLENELASALSTPVRQTASRGMASIPPDQAANPIDQMFPDSRGKTTPIKGRSGGTNQLVRLADGTSVMMGPEAYRAYQNALRSGMDEKTARRTVQQDAKDRQSAMMADRRRDELVRTKGLAALNAKPGLAMDADPARMEQMDAVHQQQKLLNQSRVQQQQERQNPLAALLRNDGTDSPIATALMLGQMGMPPQMAMATALEMGRSQADAKGAAEDRAIKREQIESAERMAKDQNTRITADTAERTKAAQANVLMQRIEAEPDPMRRLELTAELDAKYFGSPDGQTMPADTIGEERLRIYKTLGDRAEALLGPIDSPLSPEKIVDALSAEIASGNQLSDEQLKAVEDGFRMARGHVAGEQNFDRRVSNRTTEKHAAKAMQKMATGSTLAGLVNPAFMVPSGIYNARGPLWSALQGMPNYLFGE